VFIAEVAEGSVFWPLVAGRLAGLLLVLVMLRRHRLPIPAPSGNPLAILSAALDSSANACYLLASQAVRTDVAAVLASVYPAVTVVLSATLIHERVVRAQWVGVGLCICAMALIAF
jgi:drug/metabolite transporter (DMT)-like permease